jgi:hypothetical protein
VKAFGRLGEAVEQKRKLFDGELDVGGGGLEGQRQGKGAAIEALAEQPGAGAVKVQDPELGAALVEKEKEGPVAGSEAEAVDDQGGEFVESPAKIDGLSSDEDRGRTREDHDSSRVSTTRRRRAGSKPGRTRRRRWRERRISIGAEVEEEEEEGEARTWRKETGEEAEAERWSLEDQE